MPLYTAEADGGAAPRPLIVSTGSVHVAVAPITGGSDKGRGRAPVYSAAVMAGGAGTIAVSAPASTQPWYHANLATRAAAEAVLEKEPRGRVSLCYLVRPYKGVARSYVLSYVSPTGFTHTLLEQPNPGDGFLVNHAAKDHVGSVLTEVVDTLLQLACKKRGCVARACRVPMMPGPGGSEAAQQFAMSPNSAYESTPFSGNTDTMVSMV